MAGETVRIVLSTMMGGATADVMNRVSLAVFGIKI